MATLIVNFYQKRHSLVKIGLNFVQKNPRPFSEKKEINWLGRAYTEIWWIFEGVKSRLSPRFENAFGINLKIISVTASLASELPRDHIRSSIEGYIDLKLIQLGWALNDPKTMNNFISTLSSIVELFKNDYIFPQTSITFLQSYRSGY